MDLEKQKTALRPKNSASSTWSMQVMLNALPENSDGDSRSSRAQEIVSKEPAKEKPKLQPEAVRLRKKWERLPMLPKLPPKRSHNRFQMPLALEVLASQDTECEGEPVTPQPMDESDVDMFLEIHRSPANHATGQNPLTRYGCSGKPPADGVGEPVTPQPMDESDGDMVLEIHRSPANHETGQNPLTRYGCSGKRLREDEDEAVHEALSCAPHRSNHGKSNDGDDDDDSGVGLRRPVKFPRISDTQNAIEQHDISDEMRGHADNKPSELQRLHGSAIVRSSPFVPNMMLRSPSIFATLSRDLEVPPLNLQRLRLSRRSLFSEKPIHPHHRDEIEAGPSCAPYRSDHLSSNSDEDDDDDDDNNDDSPIGFRRPGNNRRISDTQNTIEQHDITDEYVMGMDSFQDRTPSPARLKKLARGFINAEAEASDDSDTEDEESMEQHNSFIVRDSQVEQGTSEVCERAMYLQSVRDMVSARGAFYFPDWQQSELELKTKLKTRKTRKRNVSDTSQ